MSEAKSVKLPKEGERNIIVTSALPYVNNRPHLGNLIGSILSADVFARYCRRRGHNTLFISGTDEYGTATETKARKEGKTPREVCDSYHAEHASVYKWFGCEFDQFGRTSTEAQSKVVQDIFLKLWKEGFVFEDSMEQLYCCKDEMFLADRFAEGTCPSCGDDGARGDQCDACGQLVNAVELVDPRCAMCGERPEVRSSNHLFLDLRKLAPRVQEWLDHKGDHWSKNCIAITHAWMEKGLEPRCITRDLKWGVPVPLEGWEDKVFYVWFDAPIGYISITASYTDEWEKWWRNPENVDLYQFMGKDNIPFHTVMFPSCLLGTGDPWTLVKNVSTTSYLNYEGGKFSKSNNKGIFGPDCMKEGLPPHVWRFYLLATRPEDADADFSWEDFVAKNNTELLAKLGNYVYRVVTVTSKRDGGVPVRGELTEGDAAYVAKVEGLVAKYVKRMDDLQLRAGLGTAMGIAKVANAYWDKEMPWKVADEARASTILNLALSTCYLLATLVEPFIPTFSEGLLEQLHAPLGLLRDTSFPSGDVLPAGGPVGPAETLVPLIEGTRIEEWWERYGSTKLTTAEWEWKVGQVTSGEKHPKGGNKYVLKVNVGEKNDRQIVAAIEKHWTLEEMQDRKVVVFCNLKRGKFGGVLSEGMILGAEDAEGTYTLLQPDAQSPPGARVLPKGWVCRPASNLRFDKMDDRNFLVRDGTLRWIHERKTAAFKKQPKKNPKGQDKGKAAPQVLKNDAPKIYDLELVVHAKSDVYLPVTTPNVEQGKIK